MEDLKKEENKGLLEDLKKEDKGLMEDLKKEEDKGLNYWMILKKKTTWRILKKKTKD
jgi:hypothetical protein